MQIREDPERGVYIAGVSMWHVRSAQECYNLVMSGDANRITANTIMVRACAPPCAACSRTRMQNASSSRSHSVLTLHVSRRQRMSEQDFQSSAPVSKTCVPVARAALARWPA